MLLVCQRYRRKKSGNFKKGFGPTFEELEKSYIRKSLFLENSSAEFQYFYTSEENKYLEKWRKIFGKKLERNNEKEEKKCKK